MRPLHADKKQGSLKVKITVITGYLLVVAVMAAGLISLYSNLVDYSNTRIEGEDMSDLVIVGNALSMLYEIESERNLVAAENARRYFHKYESMSPKIKAHLEELKQMTTDSTRINKLDSIQLLIDRKGENLLDVVAMLDSIRRAPKILVQDNSSYLPMQLNREISDYLEGKYHDQGDAARVDTSVVAGNRKGFLDRVRDVFAARPDSTVVIEKSLTVVDPNIKLIVDTIIKMVRHSERIDLERQQQLQSAYLVRHELMSRTNRMLTARIHELLKGIEKEELETSLGLLLEKERAISGSQRAMFTALYAAFLIVAVFGIFFLVGINKSQRYRRQLEASNKRISDLLASREKLMLTISHDIKAPMSSILGFIELMNTHGDPKNESYLNNMKNSGEHILGLASALLDYHMLEGGRWQLKESNFDLHGLINETASYFEPLAVRKGLQYCVENELPGQLLVYGDFYMTRQIMNNIITNAVKYTSEGSVRVKARILGGSVPERLLFSVADTGRGIDEAEQQIIFQEFKRLDNPLGEEGSGLGLAIAKGFLEALDGSIRVNSRKGEGAEFIVEIPLKGARKEMQAEDGEMSEIPQQDLEGISVLLVDDDPVQLTMISEMLAKKKIKSVTEVNPDRVLSLLQSSSFDILFMDIQMPGAGGLALVEKVRRLGDGRIRNIPVIGLSARSDMSKEKMKVAGFSGFLIKPFTSRKLYSMIWCCVKGGGSCGEAFTPEVKKSSGEKGARALIEFVRDDKQISESILQSFIHETGEYRLQLEEAFREKEEKTARRIIHKILPLFRLMGNKPLTGIMEKFEKGVPLSEEEEPFILDKIEEYLEEAETLMRKNNGE